MKIPCKSVDRLTVPDLVQWPVWEYMPESNSQDETCVRPVLELPVETLVNRIAGVRVHLNNGLQRWATLSNISLENQKRTSQFLTLAIEHKNKWFVLARYFDVDYEDRGPQKLAAFLGLAVHEVFPIRYDISGIAVGPQDILTGSIRQEPEVKLTREQRLDLIFEKKKL